MQTIDWTALNRQNKRGKLNAALVPLTPAERLEMLTGYIEQQVRFIQEEHGASREKGLERSFVAIGFDSLMSVDLLYCLERDLDRMVDPAALEQETIDDLAVYIRGELWPDGGDGRS